MITYKNGEILIDGKPTLIMAGEIHYYRLPPDEWQDRIDKLKEAGLNTAATYIPWVCHEFHEGDIDLNGKSNPCLDLEGFIRLCTENDLYIFLRPGPFIMAEMKNDGIPYWVYENYPHLIPKGFDGEEATTPTLDYLAPDFLKLVKRWYKHVMGMISRYTPDKGGRVIAVQLDNEIGMLSWVSNHPDLTLFVVDSFVIWLKDSYSADELSEFYPFDLSDKCIYYKKFVFPEELYVMQFSNDLGRYMRKRYAEYVYMLMRYAKEYGVKDVLYVVNIHGTSAGRGFSYPIGVSQLLETYAGKDEIISGSDVYFDDMKMPNFQDIYLCNEITRSTNRYGKPLACVEFNAGDSNFGDNYNVRGSAAGNDFKTRLFIAQGNKLLNYYLFSGGVNYRFDKELNDGNNRIATTGGNHGFAAPIGPEGVKNYTFDRMARVNRQIMELKDKHADSFIEYDSIAYGFIPDYYMTEYVYKKSEKSVKMVQTLERYRNRSSWESTVRAFLLSGYKLKGINLAEEDKELFENNLLIPKIKEECLVVSSAAYMDEVLQKKLVEYVKSDGKLFLHGQVPRYDKKGASCTVFMDAFGISDIKEIQSRFKYEPEIECCGILAGGNSFHGGSFETVNVTNAEPFMKMYETKAVCGFYKEYGKGMLVMILNDYKCDLKSYDKIFRVMKLRKSLSHDIEVPGVGVFMTNTVNSEKERFIYLINMDDIEKDFHVYLEGESITGDRIIHLPPNEALTLPYHMAFDFGIILYSTVEILSIHKNEVVFRNTEKYSVICICSSLKLVYKPYLTYQYQEGVYMIHTDNRLLEEGISILFV